MTKDEALKLALMAIEELRYSSSTFKSDKLSAEAITAIKAALAHLEQEPVAWMPKTWTERYVSGVGAVTCNLSPTAGWVSLYKSPQPQRPWVGLTDEEINTCDPSEECWGLLKIARAIEAKLREKNA